MLDRLTKKVAEKMGRSVKTTIEPIKNEMKDTVDHKVDLYSRILRLGVLIFLFIDVSRRVNNSSSDQTQNPNQIVINNYLTRKDGEG